MKWTANDVDMYEKERQYIDTAVIPLIPLTLSEGAKAAVSGGEFVQLLTSEIERQLKGRLFLLPPFAYFTAEEQSARTERLNDWTSQLKESGLHHVFYVTGDRAWKEYEPDLLGELFLLPVVPFEHMDEAYKRQIVHDQTSKLLNAFISRWT
ncbi:YpiF family protein [Anoxybacteroides tepidamans]|uniref:YpiF family protein n=1 Tax=Anoxybacteroides tepidamans TaxID=265948 RepID=UPI0004811C5D|nr:YpiF family protein [Anoxybacillus tepidamans]